LVTGQKITRFQIGLKPVIQFEIRSISFQFSLDAKGGEVSTICSYGPILKIFTSFLIAVAGPFAEICFAIAIFGFGAGFWGPAYEQYTWQSFGQTILIFLSFDTFVDGVEGMVTDLKIFYLEMKTEKAENPIGE